MIRLNSLDISIISGFYIILILLFRKTLNNKSFKYALKIAWGLIISRLLIPYTIRIPIWKVDGTGTVNMIRNLIVNIIIKFNNFKSNLLIYNIDNILPKLNRVLVALLITFYTGYKIHRMKGHLSQSTLLENSEFINSYLEEFKIKRKIQVLINDNITHPITYGIIRPKIIIQSRLLENQKSLKNILTHEIIHIKEFDIFWNYLKNILICIYWYNPLIWLMGISLNEDIEILCDKLTVNYLGGREENKRDYCITMLSLITAESDRTILEQRLHPNMNRMMIIKNWELKKSEIQNSRLSKLDNNLFLEIRKILEGNSLKVSLFLSFILVGVFFLQIVIKDKESINSFFGTGGPLHAMQSVLEFEKEEIMNLKELLANRSINQAEKEDLSERLDMYTRGLADTKEEIKRQEDIYDAYLGGNSKSYYSLLDWDVDFAFLKGEGMGAGFGTFTEFEEGAPSNFAYTVTKERLKELRDRNIQPLIGVTMAITSYDKFVDRFSAKWYIDNESPKNHSGLFTIYRLLKYYELDFILLGLILLFFLNGYTLEKELGNHLSLLYTQPCDRIKYYYKKIAAGILLGILFTFIIYILLIIMGGVVGGLGQWRFPILEYTRIVADPMALGENFKESFRFMNLGNYIIRTIVVMIFAIGFLVSLSMFTSLFLKSRLKLFVLNLSLCGLGYGLVMRDFMPAIIKTYLPFGYLNVSAVADGSIKLILNNNNVNMSVAILVLIIWILAFYLLSKDAIKKIEVY